MDVSNEQNHTSAPKKNLTPILIGLLVAMLAALTYFFVQNNRLKDTQELQAIEMSKTLLQMDSISRELENRIKTIAELGGEIDTLVKLQAQLEEEKKQLLTQGKNQKELIASLRDRVDGYQELLLAKDEEIAQLRQVNTALLSENVELKTEKQQLQQSIQEISKTKEQLAQQVAFAARLKVEDLKVFGVAPGGGREREGEFRNRQVERLKITFTVAENRVAPIEGKELLIRIVGPDGNVLFDVTRGSGSFFFEGRELFFSTKQEILYDKSSQKVTTFYTKGSDYAEGRHEVEIYTDEYLMGKGSFLVK